MSEIIIDHIQALIDHPYKLTAWCNRCRHHKVLDLQKLGERLGFDHSILHDDLTPKLRCEECGGKNIGLILAHDGKKGVNSLARNSNGR